MRHFSVAEYQEVSDSLFSYFFNNDGEYDPAQGRIGALYEYYLLNHDNPDEAKTLVDFHEELTPDFLKEFDKEVAGVDQIGTGDWQALTFGSAYRDAMNRVKYICDGSRQLAVAVVSVLGLLTQDLDSLSLDDNSENSGNFSA